MQGMYVGVKVRDIHTLILYVTDLLIPCLEVYALNFYFQRHSRLTTEMINLYIPLQTKMRTKFLHCSASCSRFKTCNKVNSIHTHNFTVKCNQDFLADKRQHWWGGVYWNMLLHAPKVLHTMSVCFALGLSALLQHYFVSLSKTWW